MFWNTEPLPRDDEGIRNVRGAPPHRLVVPHKLEPLHQAAVVPIRERKSDPSDTVGDAEEEANA